MREAYNYLRHMENQEYKSLEKYNTGLIVSKLMKEKKKGRRY